ncbi:hypothetical protein [Pseudoalteromonas luteoviolacea]|uniref:Uncharacterized protein n=1 Tax=Pseudoalteromonas luteoviolacea (strain 2ta16) TaxID=1353533 RepID=V4HWB9_PSEL2|nr:hypothetical protein [Pseudoalteromonas luteoviolacea]ESP92249.1 hypothetical protein PL2TA16_05086 [Pseudoalteromonas luteoviolacea 2ta16]KZN29358.1 hypothetical protein N483_07940 [Pseudoalteromonas luteoviolacea NCIMB 1944]
MPNWVQINSLLIVTTYFFLSMLLAGCEGKQNQQPAQEGPSQTSKSDSHSKEVHNVTQDDTQYVMGACVELGYPLLQSGESGTAQETSACERNLTHKFDAGTKASDTKLKWRVRVKGQIIQCQCAGYATQVGKGN